MWLSVLSITALGRLGLELTGFYKEMEIRLQGDALRVSWLLLDVTSFLLCLTYKQKMFVTGMTESPNLWKLWKVNDIMLNQ